MNSLSISTTSPTKLLHVARRSINGSTGTTVQQTAPTRSAIDTAPTRIPLPYLRLNTSKPISHAHKIMPSEYPIVTDIVRHIPNLLHAITSVYKPMNEVPCSTPTDTMSQTPKHNLAKITSIKIGELVTKLGDKERTAKFISPLCKDHSNFVSPTRGKTKLPIRPSPYL